MIELIRQIQSIRSDAQFRISVENPTLEDVEWLNGTTPVTADELSQQAA